MIYGVYALILVIFIKVINIESQLDEISKRLNGEDDE